MVNKEGTVINNCRSLYYYITHKESNSKIAKYNTAIQCKEEINKMTNPENWKIECDWVIVKG